MTPRFQQSRPHSHALVRMLMKTGKHAGLTVTVLDVPGVLEHGPGQKTRCALPGLEGEGIIVPEPGSQEN